MRDPALRDESEPTPSARPGLRRLAALLVALLVAFAAGCGPSEGPAAPAAPSAPDVLVVVLDTTRADRCSFLGYPRPTTPHLDEFAKECVVFTDAWSPGAWTYPAHAALFTGLAPERLGPGAAGPPGIPGSVPTLASTLAANGWATGCITANSWLGPGLGLSQGFEEIRPIYAPPSRETAREACDATLDFLRSRRREGRRTFTVLNVIEPHAPWNPSPGASAKFVRPDLPPATVAEARTLGFPRTALAWATGEGLPDGLRNAASDLYDAEVSDVDAEIGRLFSELRRDGALDRMLVVVTADHGEGLGDHGWMEHGTFVHREILRVPLLVRAPGPPRPRTVGDVVRLHDVFATVLEACGLPLPADSDSRSLLGDTSGRVATAVERTREDLCRILDRVASPEVGNRFRRTRRSVHDGRHHLIEDDTGGTELYDVVADPGERTNLAPGAPDVVERLRRLAPRR